MHVIYAWRDRDPLNPAAPLTIDRLKYHGRQSRGVLTLCLLHDDCHPPPDAGSNPTGSRNFMKLVAAVGLVLLGCG